MRLLSFLLMIALASSALADVIVLKDGTRYEGDVKRDGNNWRIKTRDGDVVVVPIDQVKSIDLTAGGANSATSKPSPDQAASNLASLRRSVENVADLKQIIDRFNHFIDQYKDTPSAAEAQKDLATWQDRLSHGLVKLGPRWVTPAERTEFADKALVIVAQARDLILHGRLHDGDLVLQQALDFDPQCIPALYLRGVVLFQQHQLAPARKAFETVTTLITDHAPTLNNLAVILWQQNAMMPSLAHYEQAMLAAPVSRAILDNVAEALTLIPADQRKNAVAQRVFRQFTEQDTRLQEIMAAKGFYRWGGTWVDRATMEQYRQIEKDVNEKLTVAKSDLDAAQKQVQAIDDQINSIEQSLAQLRADSVRADSNGKIIRYPYPLSYYDLLNQESKLKSDRVAAVSKGTAAQEKVKTLNAELPKPKFTGIQEIVGAEGTPQMIPPQESIQPTAPTTMPKTPNEIPAPVWPSSAPTTKATTQSE